jgi:hypothetical protein
MQPLLANPALQAGYDDITLTNALFQEMLAIRDSSTLFHLETAAAIQERVAFQNVGIGQVPGLIVMTLSDKTATDIDPLYESMVVVVNADDEGHTFSDADLQGLTLWLHPVLMNSADSLVQTSSFDAATGSVTVPGRTAAVFVEMESVVAQIDLLAGDVQALVDAGQLSVDDASKLFHRLDKAKTFMAQGKIKEAISELQKFIARLEKFILDGVISPETAEPLKLQAEFIILQLGG